MAESYSSPKDLQISPDARYYINSLALKDIFNESEFKIQLKTCIAKKIEYLEDYYDPLTDKSKDIYAGSGGLALLYLHLANTYARDNPILRKNYLEKSLTQVQSSLASIKHGKIAFVHGPAGLYSIGAVVYSLLKSESESQECIQLLNQMFAESVKKEQHPSEILFGHAGFLYALLFLNRFVPGAVDGEVIRGMVALIIETGKAGREASIDSPLMYTWHGKHYLGGAHGLAGIAMQLLNVPPDSHPELEPMLLSLIAYLVSLQKESGNFPSSLGSHKDSLVQFCHGAPGFVPVLCSAVARKCSVENLMEAATRAGEVTWERGLLTKGHGICHGVSGNAYAFLSLFRLTQDPKHIRRARAFAEWVMGREDTMGKPDRPFSLFEGISGQIYFLADMLHPEAAAFPSYELPILL